MKNGIKVEEIAHHRNGICGCPFSVVKFFNTEKGKTEPMLGIVFDSEGCTTAVFHMDKLKEGIIAFGENSCRGDRFDKDLRDAIEKSY